MGTKIVPFHEKISFDLKVKRPKMLGIFTGDRQFSSSGFIELIGVIA